MPALFWNADRRTLTEGTESIVSLRIVIVNELKRSGFEGVRRSELDVSGGRPGVFLSIAHFHIDGPNFWEIVMGSGDDGDLTRNTVNEVADKLRRLVFFD